MKNVVSKRKRFKKALKSTGRKIGAVAKSRIVKRFIPLFGLISIFKPSGAIYAFTIDDGLVSSLSEFGKNGTIIAAEYRGLRELTKQGVSAIPNQELRTAVSTIGSISSLVGGLTCGVGSAICGGMGWEQKAMICLQGVGICAGIASGMNEADPVNPATIPGKIAGDAVGKISEP